MRLNSYMNYILILLLGLSLTACGLNSSNKKDKRSGGATAGEVDGGTDSADRDGDDATGERPGDGGDGDSGSDLEPDQGADGLSLRSHVRFKKQALIERDLMTALELDRESLCRELGELSCINQVHHLALGGIDAYEGSIFEGIDESAPTTPIVLERIALSACGERARRDLADGEEVVFKRTSVPTNGQLSESTKTALAAGVTGLYQRALLREPTTDDQAALLGLFADVMLEGAEEPLETWATLACFAVLTSTEFVFY